MYRHEARRKATYAGSILMERLHRVALAVRGQCVFVEVPRRDGLAAENHIRRVGALGRRVNLDRFPWVAVPSNVLAVSASDRWVFLDHNLDSRSFAYPALIAAMHREFGSDFRWSGDKDLAFHIRVRGAGWDPAHPESGL